MGLLVIRSIGRKYLLSVDNWLWILEHRNMPLRISHIYTTDDGSIRAISIYKDEKDIITVFPIGNRLRCEVVR